MRVAAAVLAASLATVSAQDEPRPDADGVRFRLDHAGRVCVSPDPHNAHAWFAFADPTERWCWASFGILGYAAALAPGDDDLLGLADAPTDADLHVVVDQTRLPRSAR